VAVKTVATNRKAYHNYFVGEGVEAGIALSGSEIKSIRAGRVSLGDAYIRPDGGELWLVNAHIARYDADSQSEQDPMRRRKLLLKRKEIEILTGKVKEKGLTLLPVKIYLKGHLAKVEIALGQGKKLYDKRETIARREMDRELGRMVKKRAA
jgi:SsrA-binding protein